MLDNLNQVFLTTTSYATIFSRMPRYTERNHMKVIGMAAWQLGLVNYRGG